MTAHEEPRKEGREAWEPMEVEDVGHVGEILQMPGGGKLSIMAADTGDEARKPKGQEK